MKWMLIVMVFGVAPVKTGLLFDSLKECLRAEDAMRKEYTGPYNEWLAWAQQNPADSKYPDSMPYFQKRFGLENPGTCIPHAPEISN
jgi:hypothetical protein